MATPRGAAWARMLGIVTALTLAFSLVACDDADDPTEAPADAPPTTEGQGELQDEIDEGQGELQDEIDEGQEELQDEIDEAREQAGD